jgi:hypothetical protein
MQPFFDAMCALDGLPPLTYRNELRAPTKPVSVAALLATGFRLRHTVVEQMPTSDAPPPPSAVARPDRTGRDLVTSTLARVVATLGLTEETANGDAMLPLHALGGALDGRRIGEFRVFTHADGTRLVHSALTIDAFGMDTHQLYAFTAIDSPVPHLFLDTAISPNTEGTFHFGLDLVPRVDLGANLDYTQAVYSALDEARVAALSQPGVLPVPSLGPLQWSIRSPWMVAAIVAPSDLRKLNDVVTAYVDQWLSLLANGLGDEVTESVAWQDLAERDRRNRSAMFSARTNPVWVLVDRLVGPETGSAMKALLRGEPAT